MQNTKGRPAGHEARRGAGRLSAPRRRFLEVFLASSGVREPGSVPERLLIWTVPPGPGATGAKPTSPPPPPNGGPALPTATGPPPNGSPTAAGPPSGDAQGSSTPAPTEPSPGIDPLDPQPSSALEPLAQQRDDASGPGSPWRILVAVVLAAVLVAGIAIAVVKRRRRPS